MTLSTKYPTVHTRHFPRTYPTYPTYRPTNLPNRYLPPPRTQFPHSTDTDGSNIDSGVTDPSVHLTIGLDTHLWGLDYAAMRARALVGDGGHAPPTTPPTYPPNPPNPPNLPKPSQTLPNPSNPSKPRHTYAYAVQVLTKQSALLKGGRTLNTLPLTQWFHLHDPLPIGFLGTLIF